MKSIPGLCSKTSLLIETDPYKTMLVCNHIFKLKRVKNIANIKISSSLSASILHLLQHNNFDSLVPKCWIRGILSTFPLYRQKEYANPYLLGASATRNLSQLCQVPSTLTPCWFLLSSRLTCTLANHVIFWPHETATLLKSNLRYFHCEKSTFEKFDAGLKLRIVFYTHKTIKNRRKKFRVMYTLRWRIEFWRYDEQS